VAVRGERSAAGILAPEVLQILREYYASVPEDEKVEVKLTGHSAR
jgi:sulfate adenylyltransferase